MSFRLARKYFRAFFSLLMKYSLNICCLFFFPFNFRWQWVDRARNYESTCVSVCVSKQNKFQKDKIKRKLIYILSILCEKTTTKKTCRIVNTSKLNIREKKLNQICERKSWKPDKTLTFLLKLHYFFITNVSTALKIPPW